MSSTQQQASSQGIGVAGLLGVAFVVLKLCGVINWSWWWVTCPFWAWIPFLATIFVAALFFHALKAWLS